MWLTLDDKQVTSAHVTFTPTDVVSSIVDTAETHDTIGENVATAAADTSTSIGTSAISPPVTQQSKRTQLQQQKEQRERAQEHTLQSAQQQQQHQPSSTHAHGTRAATQSLPTPVHRLTYNSFVYAHTPPVERIVAQASQRPDTYSMLGISGIVPLNCKDPTSLRDAMQRDDSDEWLAAYQQEIDGLWAMGVFSDEPLPAGKQPVRTHLLFKTKLHADGTVERRKVRLVADGSKQQPGIDLL